MTKQKKNLPKVYHADLYGLREDKYEFLKEKSISTIEWTEIPPVEPNYFFVEKDFEVQEEYHKGFIIPELFTTNNVGIVTSRDSFVIDDNLQKLEERIKDFFILKKDDIQNKYSLKENKSWKIDEVKNKAQKYNKESIQRISYRPFDIKYIYYNDDFIERSRKEVMQHFLKGENVGLLTVRQSAIDRWEHVGITKLITDDSRVSNRTRERGYVFPLYLYPDDNEQQSMDEKQGRKPNLNMEIVKEIEEKLGMKFVPEKEPRTIKERTPPNEEGTPPNLPKGEALRGKSPSSGEIQDTSGLNSPSSGEIQDTSGLNSPSSDEIQDTSGLNSPSSGGVGEVTSGVGEVTSHQKPRYITANPATYCNIKLVRDELKANQTEAEKLLWEYLRNKKTGHKIRRQHIIDNFIVDFVCLLENVVIEIDGGIHKDQEEYDQERSSVLNNTGYQVIRFTNDEVLANPQKVTNAIKRFLDKQKLLREEELNKPEDNISNEGKTRENKEGTPPNLPKGEALRGNSPSSGEIQDTSGLKSPSSGGVGEVSSGVGEVSSFAPIDILDYIYAVLHSPTYREKYKEFLKIDFPRVPYPYDTEIFWKLVELGGELRQIHLLESPKVTQFITSYPNDGDNVITRSLTKKSPGFELTDAENKTGRVWINDQQYFDGVPEVAYNFYIGGYQPAQKWLKDRKKRKLSFEDIMHYQKIIVALTETDRIMKRIDEIEVDGIV